MNNLRKSRLRARRSRKANIPARSRVSLADLSRRRRPPTNPLAAWKIRFLDRFRAAPLFERIAQVSLKVRVRYRQNHGEARWSRPDVGRIERARQPRPR